MVAHTGSDPPQMTRRRRKIGMNAACAINALGGRTEFERINECILAIPIVILSIGCLLISTRNICRMQEIKLPSNFARHLLSRAEGRESLNIIDAFPRN
jgi:hypothetical protein